MQVPKKTQNRTKLRSSELEKKLTDLKAANAEMKESYETAGMSGGEKLTAEVAQAINAVESRFLRNQKNSVN